MTTLAWDKLTNAFTPPERKYPHKMRKVKSKPRRLVPFVWQVLNASPLEQCVAALRSCGVRVMEVRA